MGTTGLPPTLLSTPTQYANMSLFARVKCVISSLAVIYAIYLLTYKCHNLNETPIEHGVKSVFHPISHTHTQLCDGLNTGVNYIQPYLAQGHQLLEKHVYSHALYKQHNVDAKLACANNKYTTYVAPYVLHLWKLVEVVEKHVYDQLVVVWGIVLAQYNQHVAPLVAQHVTPKVADAKAALKL